MEKLKSQTNLYGEVTKYRDYGKIKDPYPWSDYIEEVRFDRARYHIASGDMWPVTWGADGNLYGAAGDNRGGPMNFWKFEGDPVDSNRNNPEGGVYTLNHGAVVIPSLVNECPVDPVVFATDQRVEPRWGLKPASLIDVEGMLYFSVEAQNYGVDPMFMRQQNVHGWIVTSQDYGKTWDKFATDKYFFTDRLSSCHFVQMGRGYEESIDEFVYAYFGSIGDDGNSYWENGDYMILGRVPKKEILIRDSWEFYTGKDDFGKPQWNKDDLKAVSVFRYPKMCGENHICYNKYINRFILCNYGFVDSELHPRPNHQGHWPESGFQSQLTMFESEHLWGPWRCFYRNDNWGTYGDYQPTFTPKWMYENGRIMFLISSGTCDDYNFTFQKVGIRLKGEEYPDWISFFK